MPTQAQIVRQSDIERKLSALGATFTDTQTSFAEFEQKYLTAYELIFGALSKVATVKESGGRGEAEFSMSKWMEPSRGIGVVAKKKSALKPGVIEAAQKALACLNEQFAVAIDSYPTVAFVFPEGPVLVAKGSLPEDLVALGLVATHGADEEQK